MSESQVRKNKRLSLEQRRVRLEHIVSILKTLHSGHCPGEQRAAIEKEIKNLPLFLVDDDG